MLLNEDSSSMLNLSIGNLQKSILKDGSTFLNVAQTLNKQSQSILTNASSIYNDKEQLRQIMRKS